MLKFEQFELDVEAAELRSDDGRVEVEPQVFDLLVFLARNAGRAVTKDEIIESVWSGRIVSDSAISTRINAARRALGDDGSTQKFIKTIHGRGFRFEAKLTDDNNAAEPVSQTNSTASDPIDVRYCTSSDQKNLAFAEVGSGPSVVKAASFMTHLQHDAEGVIFRDWIAMFSEKCRYVRYDERGNGLSDWEIDDFSLAAMVNDLETVVDELKLEKFFLLGTSQGASVSIEYAHRYPDRVAGLIIFGGYAAGWRHSTDEQHRARREAMLELTRISWGDDNPAARQAYAGLFLPDGTPDQHAEFIKLQQITASPENAYRILSTFAEIDVRDRLPRINVPTLVMHCSNDAVVPFKAGKDLAAAIPDARFIMLEGRNHIIQATDTGWARFCDEIERFITNHR